jgi:mono/diheme cytochrome c family protein
MKRLWTTTLVVIASLVLPACQKGGGGKSGSNAAPSSDASTKITYAGFVKGWLEENCTSCHNADGDSPDLSTYEAAKKHGDHIVKAIQSKQNPMPPDGPAPSASDVSKIKAWVAAGSPKGSAKGGGSGSASLTWDDWVRMHELSQSGRHAARPDEL